MAASEEAVTLPQAMLGYLPRLRGHLQWEDQSGNTTPLGHTDLLF